MRVPWHDAVSFRLTRSRLVFESRPAFADRYPAFLCRLFRPRGPRALLSFELAVLIDLTKASPSRAMVSACAAEAHPALFPEGKLPLRYLSRMSRSGSVTEVLPPQRAV